uniref:Solute carrier family 12 member 3 n=2 Tax=Haemonchus contortus TaxID=6289 RepID=A0A7I4YD32_HAECO
MSANQMEIHSIENGGTTASRSDGKEANPPHHRTTVLKESEIKFGWIEGVFIRCVQNIIGVILFLRITWVVAQAGVIMGVAIIFLASFVTILTAISTSTICTNGEIKGGGVYYLISRTLGAEYGGSIGLLFSMANCASGALYIVGFAETVKQLLIESGITILDGDVWDIRLVSVVTTIVLMAVIVVSPTLESKLQQILLIPLILSVLSFIIGSFISTKNKVIHGYTGYKWKTLEHNMLPDFRSEHNFFSVFSVYFPAATGIMAGANISGHLKNPQAAIPRGTLAAIAVSTVVYTAFALVAGATYARDADGVNEADQDNPPDCYLNATCPFGLHNYYQMVTVTSVWPPLITIGIVASSLCSAMASLVGAPRVFQAVCADRIIPKLEFFAKGYGKGNDPRRVYALSFVITVTIVMIGNLNVIAPFISNFFLCAYALVNYACFTACLSQTPGFRPAFRFYSPWLSLFGAVMCVSIMFVMSWPTTLFTCSFFFAVYSFIRHLKPDVNWGTSTTATTYKHAYNGVMKLTKDEPHVKNYRPQVLVLSGAPHERSSLVQLAYSITRGASLLVCGNVIHEPSTEEMSKQLATARKIEEMSQSALRRQHIKGICKVVVAPSLETGCMMLYQTCGLGRMSPNIVLLGFLQSEAKDRRAVKLETRNAYLRIIQHAFYSGMGVAILRSNPKNPFDDPSAPPLDTDSTQGSTTTGTTGNTELGIITNKKFTIDVWWLSDDGGLTLLVPYLLTLSGSRLKGANLRVFTIAPEGESVSTEEKRMASLLEKFRIQYSYLHVVPAFTKPDEKTSDQFYKTLEPFLGEEEDGMISKDELTRMSNKIARHIQTGTLLRNFSSKADLVVVTLPFPQKDVSSGLYTNWLETISHGLQCVLLIRGNHHNVLTFYS